MMLLVVLPNFSATIENCSTLQEEPINEQFVQEKNVSFSVLKNNKARIFLTSISLKYKLSLLARNNCAGRSGVSESKNELTVRLKRIITSGLAGKTIVIRVVTEKSSESVAFKIKF